MVMYAKIRWMFYREHLTISEIQRRTSLSRSTIKKWLRASGDSAVKYYRLKIPDKLTPFEPKLLLALEADVHRPKKDRRTALMLFDDIQCLSTQVLDFIRGCFTNNISSQSLLPSFQKSLRPAVIDIRIDTFWSWSCPL